MPGTGSATASGTVYSSTRLPGTKVLRYPGKSLSIDLRVFKHVAGIHGSLSFLPCARCVDKQLEVALP